MAKAAQTTSVPLSTLHHDHEAPEDAGIHPVRINGQRDADIGPLVQSITDMGLIVPLRYQTYKGIRYVVDGNRRLIALRQIHADDPDAVVLAFDVNDLKGSAAEIAIASNVIRSPLHPVDKFEAFAALVDGGMEMADIAARFSIKEREVEQALAVAALAPEVRDAWRAGAIKTEAAQAFTMEPDQKRQAAVLKRLSKANDIVSEYGVRSELVGDRGDSSRLLGVVGIDAYEAAGGKVIRDLFTDRHAVTDVALLKRCADQKLADTCAILLIDGWQFAVWGKDAEGRYSWQRDRRPGTPLKQERERIKVIDARLDELRSMDLQDDTPEALEFDALSGERETTASAISMRAYSAEDRAKLGCVVSISSTGALEVEVGYKRPAKAAAKAEQAARIEPGEKPKAMTPAEKRKAETAKLKAAEKGEVSNALAQRLAIQLLKATKAAVLEMAKSYAATHEKIGDRLPAVLAVIAADLITPEGWNQKLDEKQMNAIRAAIPAALMNESCVAAFDAEDYFQSTGPAFSVIALKEICGDGDLPSKSAELKAMAHLNATKAGWLPVQLRTVHYNADEPKPTKKRGKR